MCPRMTSTSLIWHIDRGTARCLPNRPLKYLQHSIEKTSRWQWSLSTSQLEGIDDTLSAQSPDSYVAHSMCTQAECKAIDCKRHSPKVTCNHHDPLYGKNTR